jgi:hypothetical protein
MDKLKKSTTDLMGLGIGGMAGLGAMGAMSNLPGMPAEAKGVMPLAATGVKLGMIGGMLHVAKDIVPEQKNEKHTKSKQKKDDYVSRILG